MRTRVLWVAGLTVFLGGPASRVRGLASSSVEMWPASVSPDGRPRPGGDRQAGDVVRSGPRPCSSGGADE